MIHPDTEVRFINDNVGYGVVATRLIPKGTITWVKDKLDREFDLEQFNSFTEVYRDILEKYCYRDSRGKFVLCWDTSRFVNHSFNSNCISTPYEFEIAVRDIHPGEELTDDYGYLNISEPFDCLPEPGSSRTRVMPDDLLHFHELWDAQLMEAFKHFGGVAQPLMMILEEPTQQKAKAIAQGKIKMDSILNCYYNQNGNGQARV